MAKRVQLIRHTTGGADAFTGLPGEVTIDTTRKEARVHDGLVLGGIPQARRDLDNVADATVSVAGKMTSADKVELSSATTNTLANTIKLAGIADNANLYVHPNHSGQVTSAADGAQTVVVAAITGQTDIGAAIVDADELMMSDGGVIRKSAFSRIYTYVYDKIVAAANTWAAKQTFSAAIAVTAYDEKATEYTVSSGTITLVLTGATYFYPDADFITNTPTFAFDSPAASGRVTSFTLEMLGADGATITWPGAVKWPNGNEPIWSAAVDIVSFVTSDAGTTWYGFVGGKAFS